MNGQQPDFGVIADPGTYQKLENEKRNPGDITYIPQPDVKHDVSFAIEAMKRGKLVTRVNWNRKDLRLGLQVPDGGSVNTEPYVYLLIPGSDVPYYRVPWTCSQTDLLAHDWEVVE